ncbi:MAG TPA: hypothetical protein ENN05_07885 [Deltaproteobacteria bacterium]|nr:hypothetical protein [Deltaproteobacteria bacterium]
MIITSIGVQQNPCIQSPAPEEARRDDTNARTLPEDIFHLGNENMFSVYDRNGTFSKESEDDRKEPQDEKDIVSDQNKSGEKELNEADKKEIRELEKRDREVRAHESAHIAAGAGLVRGSASYEYRKGPDGKLYVSGGEVSIDTSEEPDPKDTVRKMQRVKSAAYAPADPSHQDRRIAMQAAMKAAQAQVKVTEQRSLEAEQTKPQETDKDAQPNKGVQTYLKTAQKNTAGLFISTRT